MQCVWASCSDDVMQCFQGAYWRLKQFLQEGMLILGRVALTFNQAYPIRIFFVFQWWCEGKNREKKHSQSINHTKEWCLPKLFKYLTWYAQLHVVNIPFLKTCLIFHSHNKVYKVLISASQWYFLSLQIFGFISFKLRSHFVCLLFSHLMALGVFRLTLYSLFFYSTFHAQWYHSLVICKTTSTNR